MCKMVTLLAFVTLLLLSAASAHAQNLGETIQWMQTSLQVDMRYGFVQENSLQDMDTYVELFELASNGCQITLTKHSSHTVKLGHPRKLESDERIESRVEFNLRDLDPRAIQIVPEFSHTYNENANPNEADEAAIYFQTRNDAPVIHTVERSTLERPDENPPIWHPPLHD